MPKKIRKKAPIISDYYPYARNDDDATSLKDMIDFYTDTLAEYPQQLTKLIRKVCIPSVLTVEELNRLVIATFNGVPINENITAQIVADLKELNSYANKTSEELRLNAAYNKHELARLVQDAAIDSAIEKRVVVKEKVVTQFVTVEQPSIASSVYGFFNRVFKKPVAPPAPLQPNPQSKQGPC